MPTRDHIRGPIRPHHQEARGLAAPGQHGQRIHRGKIAPVQVFQPQHQRPLGGQRLECPGQLPRHPLRGRTEQLAAQRLTLRFLHRGGDLDEPGGGLPAQERDERWPLLPRRASPPRASSSGR